MHNQTNDFASIDNPFHDSVFHGASPLPGLEELYNDELQQCIRVIEKLITNAKAGKNNVSRGELISLSSPIAGYGKTHLINRISNRVTHKMIVMDLPLTPEVNWNQILAELVANFEATSSPATQGLSVIEEAASFLLSRVIISANAQGVIDNRDCPADIDQLKNSPGSFYLKHKRSKLINWLRKKSPLLTDQITMPLGQLKGYSREDINFWTNLFLYQFKTDRSQPEIDLHKLTADEARKRSIQLMQISSQCTPLLILADNIDTCFGSRAQGIAIADAICSINRTIPNSLLILSTNGDWWQSMIEGNLPSAIIDRLNADGLKLPSLSEDTVKLLVAKRMAVLQLPEDSTENFTDKLASHYDWQNSDQDLFARKVIRQAKELWNQCGEEYLPQPTIEAEEEPLPTEVDPAESAAPIDPPIEIDQVEQTHTPENTPQPMYPEIEYQSSLADASNNPFDHVTTNNRNIDPFGGQSLTYPDRASSAPFNDGISSTDGQYIDADTNILDNSKTLRTDGESTSTPDGDYPSTEAPTTQPTQPDPSVRESSSNPFAIDAETDIEPTVEQPKPANGHSHQTKSRSTHSPIENYYQELKQYFIERKELIKMDYPTIETLIRTVGSMHPPLGQSEVPQPGDKSTILCWKLGYNVSWIGFEPASQASFYNHILQHILADSSDTTSKIVCFTHHTTPVIKADLNMDNIGTGMIEQYFDFVEMSNDDLAMIYASAKLLQACSEKGHSHEAFGIIMKNHMPLWQRLCQPIKPKV